MRPPSKYSAATRTEPVRGWAGLRGREQTLRGGGWSEEPALHFEVRRRARGQRVERGLMKKWLHLHGLEKGKPRLLRAVGNKVLTNNVNSDWSPAGEPRASPRQGSQAAAFSRTRLHVSF